MAERRQRKKKTKWRRRKRKNKKIIVWGKSHLQTQWKQCKQWKQWTQNPSSSQASVPVNIPRFITGRRRNYWKARNIQRQTLKRQRRKVVRQRGNIAKQNLASEWTARFQHVLIAKLEGRPVSIYLIRYWPSCQLMFLYLNLGLLTRIIKYASRCKSSHWSPGASVVWCAVLRLSSSLDRTA